MTKSGFSFFFMCFLYEGLELEILPCLASLIGLLADLLSFMTWPERHDRYPEEYESWKLGRHDTRRYKTI